MANAVLRITARVEMDLQGDAVGGEFWKEKSSALE